MAEYNLTLIGIPLGISILAVLIQENAALLLIFTTVAAFGIAIAATAITSALGSVQIFGSGVDLKDWSLNFIFTTTFLTGFYLSNIVAGLNIILTMPLGFGILIFGVLSTMYVLGMFEYVASE